MATYAVGDIQGCYEEFARMLEMVSFDPAEDRLWLLGDLINRGSKNLPVVRLVQSLGSAASTVLGNHDLHFWQSTTAATRPIAPIPFKTYSKRPMSAKLQIGTAIRRSWSATDRWDM